MILGVYNKSRFATLFWVAALIQVLTWSVLPVYVRHGLNPDFIEAVTWGHQFSWGYDKNPWLPGLLAHAGIVIGGESGIGIYFIQSCFILLGLWSVWRLTEAISNSVYALVAALMLGTLVSYTIELQIYNDNYILMGLLPYASLIFFRILQKNKLQDWLAVSAVLGLATMGKYDAILLGISFLIFLIVHPNRKHYFFSYKIVLAMILYLAICLPNIIWLFQHDFITLTYTFNERGKLGQTHFSDVIENNLMFIKDTIINFLPALLLMGLAFSRQSTIIKPSLTKQEKSFIVWAAMGPILILLFMGFFMGIMLHSEWSTTFVGLWGTLLLVMLKPSISMVSLNRFIGMVFLLLILLPTSYYYFSMKNDAGGYPAPEIAKLASTVWREHYHTKLHYVAGDRYVAGYVGLHAIDKPAVWMEWNSAVSPWINVNDLKCKGALFIQDSGHSKQQFFSGLSFPDFVVKSFPTLKVLPPIHVKWYRNNEKKQDLYVLIGLLPPKNIDSCKV